MNEYKDYSIILKVKAPVLSQGNGGAPFGIDTTALKDDQNRLILPGTHIQGKLVHSLRKLKAMSESFPAFRLLESLLGVGSVSDSDVVPYRKKLVFRDFVEELDEPRDHPVSLKHTITRIKINDETGTTEQGAMQVIDNLHDYGQVVTFKGSCSILSSTTQDTEGLLTALRACLGLIPQVGAFATIGFGEVISFSLSPMDQVTEAEKPLVPASSSCQGLALALTFEQPFCIAKPDSEQNLFESVSHIPGNVLKGVVAEQMRCTSGDTERQGFGQATLQMWPNLSAHFEALYFQHAFASRVPFQRTNVGVRPLSLFSVRDPKEPQKIRIEDAIRLTSPCVIKTSKSGLDCVAPVFQADWKSVEAREADKALGFETELFSTQTITRTAIDSHTNAALENQLFTYQACAPAKNVRFNCNIQMPGFNADTQQALMQEFETLIELGGGRLRGFGKTKADARVEVARLDVPARPVLPVAGQQIKVMLKTNSLMCDLPLGLHQYNHPAPIREAYENYWLTKSNNSLILKNYFATQSLTGGRYLKMRTGQQAYLPWWMTQAGSVFLLEVVKGQESVAHQFLSQIDQTGLPVDGSGTAEGWKTNPFLNSHGFGEVDIFYGENNRVVETNLNNCVPL